MLSLSAFTHKDPNISKVKEWRKYGMQRVKKSRPVWLYYNWQSIFKPGGLPEVKGDT